MLIFTVKSDFMIEIFFKSKGHIVSSNSAAQLEELGFDDVLWIDLLNLQAKRNVP